MTPQTPQTPGALTFLQPGQKPLWIGGAWITTQSSFDSHDPATGAHLATLSRAGAAEADAAVTAATLALPLWAALTPAARGGVLWRIADLIEHHADELAELETLDQGKTLRTGRMGEIPGAIAQFRYYAGFATKILGTTIPTSIAHQPPGKRIFAYTLREPIGVVAAIVPWNSPLLMAAMKLAPALCAGCTVVLKPAEETSLTALRLGELLQTVGLPPGTVNILTGYGHEVGAALTAHPGVAKVAFTGSTETGRILLGAARGNLKKLTLELGGKSPAVVMADADMALAVPGVARGIFGNAGQVCVAGSRVYVQSAVFDQFASALATEAAKLRLGPGLDPQSDLGPLVNAAQADRVAAYVTEGQAAGATILTGGTRTGGAYYAPTVLTGTTPDMRLMREEIFGPVVTVTPFDDPEQALAMANDTQYGLAASVWTQSLTHAHRMASGIKAGTVWVNCHSYFSPELPKGGHRESGWGYENGAQGLENYLESKTVCMVL